MYDPISNSSIEAVASLHSSELTTHLGKSLYLYSNVKGIMSKKFSLWLLPIAVLLHVSGRSTDAFSAGAPSFLYCRNENQRRRHLLPTTPAPKVAQVRSCSFISATSQLVLAARSICTFDETDFSGAAGDSSAFQSTSTATTTTTTSFNRLDNSDDSKFYKEPRFVNHIDDAAIEALTSFYQAEFAESSTESDDKTTTRRRSLDILDLCSSWTSHFPQEAEEEEEEESFKYGRVVGLGMNEEELKANPFLTERIVHDLNQEPLLGQHFPEDGCFDIITMAVSVDYLIQPLTVFQEIHRLLRPGTGKVLISFSNRCFPTKAIATWLQADDLDRLTLVASYFHYSVKEEEGSWSLLEALDLKDATLQVPARPSVKDIFANPAVGLAWMNSAAAVQKSNAGDPMFVVKGVKA